MEKYLGTFLLHKKETAFMLLLYQVLLSKTLKSGKNFLNIESIN